MDSPTSASEPEVDIPVLGGGTDAGSMLVFDPAALPNDYDALARNDPVALNESLAKEGKLYWLDTEADGSYNLGVCTSGEVPPQHAPFARQLGVTERFSVPSGKLYFTGIEYGFRYDDTALGKNSPMGSHHTIDAGIYRLTIYEMEYPEDFHEQRLRERLPARSHRLYSLMNLFMPMGCLSTLVLLVSPFKLGLRAWSITALPICVALILPAIIVSRSPRFRELQRVKQAVEAEYPDYLAVLRPVDP
ncbi:MAG TPA: hypothetical protein VHC22_06655 [Pirellulales bacterium]|nr:hypothetical protein [Pirellulales bacterium]